MLDAIRVVLGPQVLLGRATEESHGWLWSSSHGRHNYRAHHLWKSISFSKLAWDMKWDNLHSLKKWRWISDVSSHREQIPLLSQRKGQAEDSWSLSSPVLQLNGFGVWHKTHRGMHYPGEEERAPAVTLTLAQILASLSLSVWTCASSLISSSLSTLIK